MCKVCDITTFTENWDGRLKLELANGSYTTLSIMYDRRNKDWVLMASGEGSAESNISFCPNCGEKLICV